MDYSHHPLTAFTLIIIVSLSHSETGDLGVNGDGDGIPQCNNTCTYIAWAYDANCRDLNLEAVPQECWEAKTIDLRDNKITRVTSNVFGAFHNLLFVDLEYNGIVELDPDAFVGNVRVRHIYLQSNNLETVRKDSFTGVPNLAQLYLNSNRITTVEIGAFTGLSKLEMLFLSENLIDDLPVGVLSGLSKLRYFHATHNRLTVLRNDTFKNLASLRHLNFINNNIRVIEARAFKGLPSLQSLRLAYNDISVVGFRAFTRLPSLIQLDLYSNKIETISNFTTSLGNIKEVFLGDNPLMCDCQMTPLKTWFQNHEVSDSKANATCAGPEDAQGFAIKDVSPQVMICTPPKGKFVEVIQEENLPDPSNQGSVESSSYGQQSMMYSWSTKAIIIIVCIVLFAVFFVGVVCFIYIQCIRKPFNHKQYYKQISKTESDTSDKSNSNLNITINPSA